MIGGRDRYLERVETTPLSSAGVDVGLLLNKCPTASTHD
jgi:hypothetical protein